MKTFYAIGDIHGMFDQLEQLHEQIHKDIADNKIENATIIHLGDYIDRGPKSKEVVRLLQSMEKASQYKCINLLGNHEQLMIDAYNYGRQEMHLWIMNGGDKTLDSYGTQKYEDRPIEDLVWMQYLPYYHREDQYKLFFVHAGFYPKDFPNLSKDVCIWTKNESFFADQFWNQYTNMNDWLIIHGHSVFDLKKPTIHQQRLNLDTGCCFGGKLTAAKIQCFPNFKREISIFQV